MDLINAIKLRKSVRTFDGTPLNSSQKQILTEAFSNVKSPFGPLPTIKLERFNISGPTKPGTYGVISGASDYLLMAMEDSDMAYLSAGYVMEEVVLRATEISLGTCWIAGTFRDSTFGTFTWPDNQSLKIVIPVGTPSVKSSLFNKMARTLLASDKRKPFSTLFFNGSFDSPAQPDSTGFRLSLELLRLAPSSTNSQPWRAVAIGNTIHFYISKTKRLLFLDLGIALRHFTIGEAHQNFEGKFFSTGDHPQSGDRHYVVSYTRTDNKK